MKVFEAMTIFEQQILCHKLPNAFNHINISNDTEEEGTKKQQKSIQDTKRRMLHMELERYETKIQHYERLYEQELDNSNQKCTDSIHLIKWAVQGW